MKISVFGMGYVGAVSAACLARDGHEVIGVDLDPHKLELLRSGRSPIVEEGVQELTRQVVEAGRLTVTDNVGEAIGRSDLSFVCVGTPSKPNGSQDLSAIERVSGQIGDALAQSGAFHAVIMRSTVKPGTVTKLVQPILEQHSGKRVGEHFGLGFQPEFLREGTSIKDYDAPPFTVIGTDSERTLACVRPLFEKLPCEFIGTDIGTAEMLKYACNAFHAAKIVFANEIGRLSQHLGVDSREVMRLVTLDRQLNISPVYLRPGYAFGGSCLPKDLRALLYIAKEGDLDLPMLSGVASSNQRHIDYAVDYVLGTGKRNVGMIGLSFKSGTDDMRESPLVTMAERLIGKGLRLSIHDPNVQLSRVLGANRRYIDQTIPHLAQLLTEDLDALIDQSELIVLGLNDKDLVERLIARAQPGQEVLDLVSLPGRERLQAQYRGICW